MTNAEIINMIRIGITATDGQGDYFVGMRNGMKWCLSLLDGKEPLFDCLEQEPKTGHWVDIKNHHYYNDGDIETTELRCSCCNEIVEWDIESLHKPYYCENCGAKMEGGEINGK